MAEYHNNIKTARKGRKRPCKNYLNCNKTKYMAQNSNSECQYEVERNIYIFSYSASSEFSGITDNATAFVGCDAGKVCYIYTVRNKFIVNLFIYIGRYNGSYNTQ